MIATGSQFVVKSEAHDKMINCMKVLEIFNEKFYLITTGEDEVFISFSYNFF